MMHDDDDSHLSKEVDSSSNDEGRNGGADHRKEGDGANVLKEVSLEKHVHTLSSISNNN